MILISLERTTRTRDLVLNSGFFAVTILDASQFELSERFAGKVGDENDRFSGLTTETLISGAPLINGGIAYFDCRVVAIQEAGTSTVFFAEVMAARNAEGGDPLVYSDRSYFTLQK